ncbi:MAG TPA: hypothetical protein VN612_14065 [Acidobacteriaceae bacterium]|nr:hypothetical protein [Acidobacteriaceae bacterium]
MKLLRFDSPEMTRSVTSSAVLACWRWIAGALIHASLTALFFGVFGSFISIWAAFWFGVPVFIGMNLHALWWHSHHAHWAVAGCGDKVFVRLFWWRGKKKDDPGEPDVLMLEASEIASMFVRTVEVYIYGPKPKFVEWLVIEPAEAVAEEVSDRVSPLQSATGPNLCGIKPIDPRRQVSVGNEVGPLTIEWKWIRPDLRTFLQQLARECPSVSVASEVRSELDLNGIWGHNIRGKPNLEQRRLLAQAIRLGFGSDCVHLLSLHWRMPLREARSFLAEVMQDHAGPDLLPVSGDVVVRTE